MILFVSLQCKAAKPTHIKSLSELELIQTNTVTTPYYVLSGTKYTTDLHSFAYQDLSLKVLSKENPNKILLEIARISSAKPHTPMKYINVKLPWWSTKVPEILKKLNFSQVDGKAAGYQLGNNYRLNLLARQGHWGKVYVLEHILDDSTVEKICAVKVLLTRPEYKKTKEYFRTRHSKEIQNNLQLAQLNLQVAYELFGIIENDADHYLLFTEYGLNAHEAFKQQPLSLSVAQMHELLQEIDKMHLAGIAHGDLKIDNMLLINNQIKLCDWYSLDIFTNSNVGNYRYIGDNLPPEAMRAFYFKENDALKYSQVYYLSQHKTYILHPIAADRFCVAISMLEILAPDLYQGFEKLSPKGFNPYSPESLDFWQANAAYLAMMQGELLDRAENVDNLKQRQLFKLIAKYVNIDPEQRG
jgi:serine/threonine protein kinase